MSDEERPDGALLADVDPAFTAPGRPVLYVQNVPAPGEVEALLGDRARLRDFLTHGHRLFRHANSRQWASARALPLGQTADGTADYSYGQRSNADSQRATRDLYSWLHLYGPTLLLLLDRALLEGAIDGAWRAQRALPPPAAVDMQGIAPPLAVPAAPSS